MTVRPGNPDDFTFATTALGASTGVNFSGGVFNSNCVLISVSVVYVASGTGGSRIPVIRMLNPEGLILWSAVFGTAVTSGQTSRLLAGSGVSAVASTTPLQQTFPIPIEFTLEAGSSIQILDAANIDTTDTVQPNILVVY